eukprot:GILJ01016357.1.p1 GENE.GILJ01016357.1~~GILJ01016357.1.p1  ORF type:complete len:195 (-),score=20.95 GILJ01016357.1:41-625(-)
MQVDVLCLWMNDNLDHVTNSVAPVRWLDNCFRKSHNKLFANDETMIDLTTEQQDQGDIDEIEKARFVDKNICYILRSHTTNPPCNKTYCGKTNRYKERLREHNGEVVGGAYFTRAHRPWRPLCYISGFQNQRQALQFEKAVKVAKPRKSLVLPPKSCGRYHKRMYALMTVLQRDKWSQRGPSKADVPLHVTWWT